LPKKLQNPMKASKNALEKLKFINEK